jgi:hypothetical protein
MATVSVILLSGAPGDTTDQSAMVALRAQSMRDWVAATTTPDRLNDAIAQAEAPFVLVIEPGVVLRPEALRSMVDAAEAGDAEAVVGRYGFTSPIGELPANRPMAAPTIGEEEWGGTNVAPLGAQLFWRDVLAAEMYDPTLADAAGWDWCLRLARRGVRWLTLPTVVADVRLRPLAPPREALASIRRLSRVGTLAPVTAGGAPNDAAEPHRSLAEAERRTLALIEFKRQKGAWMHPGLPMPWRFAQWWQRCGFLGPAPDHLLNERSGPPPTLGPAPAQRRPIDIFVASYKRPDRLAAMIESVRATGYPARVCVAAGDPATVEACERFPDSVDCVYSTAANRRTGCTAPLNHVVASLVRHDALFCTDDCVFAPDALDIAVRSLDAAYPDSDGVVGLAQENIPDGYELAFPLIGRRFLERFTTRGPLFFPGYFHMYNDAELGVTIKALGRWHFEPRATLRHFHPCTGVAEDATHTRGRTFGHQDAQLWHERRMAGVIWGVDA